MQHVLTLIGDSERTRLDDPCVAEARRALEALGAETAAPDWLSPTVACDVAFDNLAPDAADAAARKALNGTLVDVVAQAAVGRRKRLLVADMDSTIVDGETLDELADAMGLKDKIAEITDRAMNGEIDFRDALRERVAMLKGLKAEALDVTMRSVRLMPGAKVLVKTMRAAGAYTALVSGGFTFFTERIKRRAGFQFQMGNELVVKRGKLTGEVKDPIVNRDGKLKTLIGIASDRRIPLAETMAVGDGANDLPMLKAAGLGVAFRARPLVREHAPQRIDHGDLTALLYAQGFRAEEFQS